ncbi:FAD-dependent monooxygenase [Brachybacterium sp. NPDC056505]|uniref:FAD-dependent monooxygenase n=1 Tax=Brachybacterium sp. NPDC056505 TaxID=3345843 RepID=UPI00366D0E7E
MARVLVVGAGIAGDTVALLLDRQGWDVTVVEIAPDLRSGGQTVDLRAGSREVLARMGLLDAVLADLVDQRGIAWVDAHGGECAAMPVEAFDGRGFVSREEVLRTDLARTLHEACSDRIDHRFSETVEAIDERADAVRVRFRSGRVEEFDLVVGADGMHSRVRSLLWGPEERFRRPLGLAHAWCTIEETVATPTLDGWFLVHNAPGGRLVEARPGHPGTQEVGFSFRTTGPLPSRRDRGAQIALLERTFGHVGWRAQELLARAADAPDFALETIEQIGVPRWHTGRVVLLGDSAWCTSPLSGLGTALALLGAEALANELGDGAVPLATALASFEERMRPRAQAARKLLPGRVASHLPRTRVGIRASALAMRAVQWPVVSRTLAAVTGDRGHGEDG